MTSSSIRLRRKVPAAVPSVRQSPSEAHTQAKPSPGSTTELNASRVISLPSSRRDRVPAAVPSVTHSSTSSGRVLTRNRALSPIGNRPEETVQPEVQRTFTRTVPSRVPSVCQSSKRAGSAGKLETKSKRSPTSSTRPGTALHGPGQTSRTRNSLPGVPSLTHSSVPEKPSSAAKKTRPAWTVIEDGRYEGGSESQRPAQTSVRRSVPPGVPSDRHSSTPCAGSLDAKYETSGPT